MTSFNMSNQDHKDLDDLLEMTYKPKIKRPANPLAKPTKRKTPERDFQIDCLKWFRLQHAKWRPYYFMVKQESFSQAAGQIAKNMGLRAGVADMLLALPRRGFHCLWVEIKWDAPWTDEQKQFKLDVEKEGSRYVLIRKDLEKFQKLMNWYLKETA